MYGFNQFKDQERCPRSHLYLASRLQRASSLAANVFCQSLIPAFSYIFKATGSLDALVRQLTTLVYLQDRPLDALYIVYVTRCSQKRVCL